MQKPNIVSSSCLLGENVRYDGNPIDCPLAKKLSKYVNVIPVCPEVSIGLPVPRDPIVVVKKNKTLKVVNPKTGEDLTDKLLDFSKKFLSTLKDIDGFFLKSKSPSCGVSGTKTYKRPDGKGFLYRGKGLFAKTTKEMFPYLPIEDELRLKDKDRYFHFLLRIFLFSKLRNVKTEKGLKEFHEKHKILFLFFSKKGLLRAEKILTLKDKDILSLYKENLLKTFYKKPSLKSVLKRFSERLAFNNPSSLVDIYKEIERVYPQNVIPKELLDVNR